MGRDYLRLVLLGLLVLSAMACADCHYNESCSESCSNETACNEYINQSGCESAGGGCYWVEDTTTTSSTTTTTPSTTTSTTGSTTTTTLAAFLSNVSISSNVHINDYVTASVQLTNSNGPLEGQDCSVVSYYNGTMLNDYHTLCQYSPQIICGLTEESGGCNYAATTNCSFTDSGGGYYFKGRTDESLGYWWNKIYELRFTCNGKNSSGYFTLGLEKQPDTNKFEAFFNNYGGMVVLGVLVIFGLLGFISLGSFFVSWAWRSGKKKH